MKYLLPAAATAFALAMAFFPSKAQDITKVPCPAGAQSCKVVIMTSDEQQSLLRPGGVFDQALWANRSGMEALLQAWKNKIAQAPDGIVAKPEQKEDQK
jgi:hypothetical protein